MTPSPLPIGLPSLPLPGNESAEGAELTVSLRLDSDSRWCADMLNEYGDVVDVFAAFDRADHALAIVSDNYPGAVFVPPDMAP